MNKIFTLVITLALALCTVNLFSQIEIDSCVESFYFPDANTTYDFLYIDSLNNPQNIWQIGMPEKTNIPLPYSPFPYPSMVTDTMLPYPTNDTSSFIVSVCHFFQGGFLPYVTVSNWELIYYMDSDSLNDFGKIEVSVDQGNTWWNLQSAGLTYGDTILTGNTGGLVTMKFDPTFDPTPDFYNHLITVSANMTIPIETMWIKFTFTSDENPEEKMGWVIQSLFSSQGLFSSVEDIRANSFAVKTFPNPANDLINLKIENEASNNYDVQFFNTAGQLILQTSIQNGYQKEIDISNFPQGIYHYIVTKFDVQYRGFGKIICIK